MGRIRLAGLALCAASTFLVSVPSQAQDEPARSERRVLKGMHEQVRFDKDVARTAVGDQKVLSADALDSRTILLLGRETGRTSLLVWFSDNTMQAFDVTVQPDLGLLQRALKDIHPNLTVEMAPDRPAVVLRGTVPDILYSRNAEAAAASYLRAERGANAPDIAVGAAGDAGGVRTVEKARQRDHAVINLIRVEKLPATMEQRVEDAIRALGAGEVTVQRLLKGDLPDDATDVLMLRGKVQDQVMLTRVLHVAATMIQGSKSNGDLSDDLKVTSDESGGLPGRRNNSTSGGGSSRSGSGSTGLGGSSGGTSGGNLNNALEANPGRAKAVSLANGRILSFIEVTSLPQVRVNVRVYEVNRTALQQYSPELSVLSSDFNQPSLSPAAGAVGVQGSQAARVGGAGSDEVQNVVGFLQGGFSNEFQYAGKHIAIDSVLNVLESRGIARSLSNPSLTVLSGESANFQVGGEIPIPQAFSPAFGSTTTAGQTTPGVFSSVEFRRFGVELTLRPLIGDDGRVTLDLFSQIDEPDAQLTTLIRDTTGTDPATTAFQSRSIQTTARLNDGQSLMIGGLISRRAGDDTTYTPTLEKIPLVGWLFKRYSVEDTDREIVVVVNPAVVREPIPDLGVWTFPDVSAFSRRWVDEMIEFGMNKWPQHEKGSK